MFETGNQKEAVAYRFTVRECLFADSHFYRKVLYLVLPMIIQNTLTNVVSLLDNVMVGQVGTLAMSSVAIVNQVMFVFYLCIWGALAGAGIYGTQFYGKGDMEGVRYTLRFKLIVAAVICTVALVIFGTFGENLIRLYISADTGADQAAETLRLAKGYLRIMLIGLIPFGITQCYGGTLRESGHTTLPMAASMTAMAVNFVFNALLIFGLLGFPKMGVAGAAVATVISRFVELGVILIASQKKKKEYVFLMDVFRRFYIPLPLVGPVLSKTLPLMGNEFLWSMAQATLLQCYSVRGIQVIAAMNISNTISQIFNEAFLSMGNATSIVVGQELGADRLVNARRTAYRMMALSVMSCCVVGMLLFACSSFIPQIYNTEPEIRRLATRFIMVVSCLMPVHAFANVTYFTLRSGGKTLITFIFDSCFAWAVSVPAAFCLSRFTTLPVLTIFTIVSSLEALKCILGWILVKQGLWVRNIVKNA